MTGTSMESFTRGEAIGVDVAGIERELAALWRQSSAGGEAVTRACLWNLVVRAEEESFERARSLARTIVPSLPARVLVLRHLPAPGPELDAWLSANCQLAPGGGKLLCSEEIVLEARGAGEQHLPALVRALLVPDVPSALWWVGALPEDDSLLCELCAEVSRLVVDTGEGVALRPLAALAASTRRVVADLGWLRLGPLRRLFASFFDAPVGAEPLRRARSVEVSCAPGGETAALLAVGWLASRLGWRVRRPRGRVLLERPGGEITARVDAEEGPAPASGLRSLTLASEDGCRFRVAHAGPSRLELCGTGLPARVVAAPDRTPAELLIAALGVRGRDPAFPEALSSAAELGT